VGSPDVAAASRVAALPDFPWDSLLAYKATAQQHADGIVDLSVGTPVDPTPEVVRAALAGAADAPGYPQTAGTPALREAVAAWFARRRGVPALDPDGVLPTIGSKELVAWLPTLLGLGPEHTVVVPRVAYPTYDVGARIAGCRVVVADASTALGAGPVDLVWVNSPSNPTGRVLGAEHLAEVVAWARGRGAVVASDECYAELSWDGRPAPSVLDPAVCGGSHDGLLAVYSLSKQSNLAGYRSAFVAGDPPLVRRLLEVRKHAGMIVPAPVQAATVAALADDDHVERQREVYRARREVLLEAVSSAGFEVEHSGAGLYLWATQGEDCWDTVAAMAERGVLVAPGSFYGEAGRRHVRIALTAPDAAVAQVPGRLRRR